MFKISKIMIHRSGVNYLNPGRHRDIALHDISLVRPLLLLRLPTFDGQAIVPLLLLKNAAISIYIKLGWEGGWLLLVDSSHCGGSTFRRHTHCEPTHLRVPIVNPHCCLLIQERMMLVLDRRHCVPRTTEYWIIGKTVEQASLGLGLGGSRELVAVVEASIASFASYRAVHGFDIAAGLLLIDFLRRVTLEAYFLNQKVLHHLSI